MDYIYQLILMFFIYSFGGWIVEVIFTRIFETHKFVNRGFLTGPICPIYGFGAIFVVIFLTKYMSSPIVLYFMSIVIASILEYTTSYIMEKVFKNRWWDYSQYKYNINGRICLETMIPFGFLALFMMYILNPFILSTLDTMPDNVIKYSAITLSILTIIDIILSFNIIITLKNISSNIRCDSTEAITKKVKEILFSKTIFHRRLIESFPDMKVFNKRIILKNKINKDKEKLKLEKKKAKEKRKK